MDRAAHRSLTALTIPLLGLFALAPAGGAAEAPVEHTSGCTRDIGRDVAALVNRAPVVFADIAVGSDGRTAPGLAAALGVPASGREARANGLLLPSPVEQAIQTRLYDHPCFRAFRRVVAQGAEDVSGINRAVMQVEMPYAGYRELTVEYAPGKFRRNYLFQASFGFELRDADGKVVFARSFADNYRRTCFRESDGGDCVDLNGQPIDARTEWRQLIDRSLGALLEGVGRNLSAWRDLLATQQGEFLDRRYSMTREVDALQVRNRQALALPYLFVQTPTPRINIVGLLEGLRKRGYAMPGAHRDELQNHYNVLFRSYLDRSLRGAIGRAGDAANARIVLLSDAQSAAFENAMIITCAEQTRGYNREDCLEPVKLIERLCDASSADFGKARNPRGDACVLSSLAYGRSLTRKNDEALGKVRDAEQRIQAAGYLRSPEAPRDRHTQTCRNAETGHAAAHLVGTSATYYRVDGESENDDGIYLLDASLDALQQQADCLAAALIERYVVLRDE